MLKLMGLSVIGIVWIWTIIQLISSDFHQITATLTVLCIIAVMIPFSAIIAWVALRE